MQLDLRNFNFIFLINGLNQPVVYQNLSIWLLALIKRYDEVYG